MFLRYSILPAAYIAGILLIEFYPNVLSGALIAGALLLSIIAIFRIVLKKTPFPNKAILFLILSIPFIDLGLGISRSVVNRIKGEIVFMAIDKSFATTRSITVRSKNEKFSGEYNISVAGFGEDEEALVEVESPSAFSFRLKDRDYSERLVFDEQSNIVIDNQRMIRYRILENTLLKIPKPE